MISLKCKMCGGQLEVTEGSSVYTCEYCGTNQTVTKTTDENIHALFNRANILRMKAEFDKAAEIYEKIIRADETEAEAYWGLILCKYGIEYVEDPVTYKRVPTCHRTSFDAIVTDNDYKLAIEYADLQQRAIYEQQAKEIDEIQRGILSLVQKEEPFDIFICYKETDAYGKRTQDSVIANEIYYQLTHEGFKVFYAAITLEDKLGQEYEPYIFAALNSSKVMLAIGTKPEYFNAAWVKNEWSRFLKIMKKDRSKMLIPCYRDMDAYELPEDFAHFQAQDMGRIGFINDLIRGIKKVLGVDQVNDSKEVVAQQATVGVGVNVIAQIKRGNIALEDKEWEKAENFFEKALNLDPECAQAYFGEFLASLHSSNIDEAIAFYLRKYDNPDAEKLFACDEEKDRIEKMSQKYSFKGYLEYDKIRQKYNYNRSFDSYFKSRKKLKEQFLEDVEQDRLLKRAKQYAADESEIIVNIDELLSKVAGELENRIQKAKKSDEENTNYISEDYMRFLDETDEKVKKEYERYYKDVNEQKRQEELIEAQRINKVQEIHNEQKRQKELIEAQRIRLEKESKIRAIVFFIVVIFGIGLCGMYFC